MPKAGSDKRHVLGGYARTVNHNKNDYSSTHEDNKLINAGDKRIGMNDQAVAWTI